MPCAPPWRAAGSAGTGPSARIAQTEAVWGGVLAQAAGAVVHHRGDLGQVGAPGWVGHVGYPPGLGALRLGKQRVDARADPGIQDGGDVAGSGQVSGGEGSVDDVSGI